MILSQDADLTATPPHTSNSYTIDRLSTAVLSTLKTIPVLRVTLKETAALPPFHQTGHRGSGFTHSITYP